MPDREAEKMLAARYAVALVKDGMRVGLGSGSTAAFAVKFLGERVRHEGLRIVGVPTSAETRALAERAGIPLAAEVYGFELHMAIDGCDETTAEGELIKGGGGALLHERIVAAAAEEFIVIADSSKLVRRLGRFPLPVEVVQFGWYNASQRLEALGCEPKLRMQSGQPFLTTEGNLIIDCPFEARGIDEPHDLAEEIRSIPGVVDHGLFLGMAQRLIIGRGDEVEEIRPDDV